MDEVLWDVAKNCISRLSLTDCVIYLVDADRQVLVQRAAYGTKNPQDFDIYHPIEIPVGEGIVGNVARSGMPEIISDTSRDARYIADDEVRLSEIAVPLEDQGQVIGVIDSEHPEKNFFSEEHLSILKTIAALCSNKIVKARAEENRQKAETVRQEAERIKALDEAKSRFLPTYPTNFVLRSRLSSDRSNKSWLTPCPKKNVRRRNACTDTRGGCYDLLTHVTHRE